jgi:hypothetical protein
MISLTSGHAGTKRSSEQGQISIFFASSVIVLISIIAFVINIGLFVKAKINLQNATDAAAYAGAAVQARMLNRIGYMNWDMRNNYKEWMFKYYVLGNLNIKDVRDGTPNPSMSYRMEGDPNLPAATGEDIYNFPSVCIHYAGVPTNVCRRYAIPGIPRFEPTNLVGIDETTSSFIDAIVKEKSSDCSKRTQLNFNVTNLWAYNLRETDTSPGVTSAFADAPQVAVDRVGAWPKAVELAIRTRAIEFAMNRPPATACANVDTAAGNCNVTVGDLESENHAGNERLSKAYWSGYRNLTNTEDREMKPSFTLTELAPRPVSGFAQRSLSTMLMGPTGANTEKHYIDLKIQMVNYATFFTALIARDDNLTVPAGAGGGAGTTVRAEGACDVSKIAIPVPGFPMGFFKNPEVVTYYAVKGEALFNGLFNPFTSNSIRLTAWAAAKPMGGRIGPALFRPGGDDSTLTSRVTANRKRSNAYLSGLNLVGIPRKGGGPPISPGEFAPGMPIPINSGTTTDERFWIADPNDQVGGWVSGPGIVFGVPNMVYDFIGGNTNPNSYTVQSQNVNVIQPARFDQGRDAEYASGLYLTNQFTAFQQNLVGVDTPDEIVTSIFNARAPTAYEAANYTIPFPYRLGVDTDVGSGTFLDTFGTAAGEPSGDLRVNRIRMRVYAPLFSATNKDALFRAPGDVANAINEFINEQQPAMRKYRDSMNRVAKTIFDDDPVKYEAAAKRISDFDFSKAPTDDDANPSCASIAGTFLNFFFGGSNFPPPTPSGCPQPLKESIEKYFASNIEEFNGAYHVIEYRDPAVAHPRSDIIGWQGLLTGYMPGPLRGASQDGIFATPFNTAPESMRRTGYSTKLVTLQSLSNSGHYNESVQNASVYSEGIFSAGSIEIRQANGFRNALDLSAAGVPSTVNH